MLLDLARGLFEETASLDAMMTQVMKEAQQLIPCEHCTVIILDQENEEVHVLYTLLLIETHIYIGTSVCIHVCIHTDVCHENCISVFFLISQNMVFTQAYQIEGFSDEIVYVRYLITCAHTQQNVTYNIYIHVLPENLMTDIILVLMQWC